MRGELQKEQQNSKVLTKNLFPYLNQTNDVSLALTVCAFVVWS